MSYNTQAIKTDVNGKPIPQYFNAQQDQYEALLGQDGAARAILYGPDGQPIGTSGNPLQVKAQDTDDVLEQVKTALEALATEDKLEAVRTLLASLVGKDFATQTTLAQVKQVLDTLNIAVEDLKSELILVKSELATIKANQLSGDQKVQLSGQTVAYDPASDSSRVRVMNEVGVKLRPRLAESLMVFDRFEMRTTLVNQLVQGLGRYSRLQAYIRSTLDVDVTLFLRHAGGLVPMVWSGTGWVRGDMGDYRIVISGDGYWKYLHTTPLDMFFSRPYDSIWFYLIAETAPTTGNITLELLGVPN